MIVITVTMFGRTFGYYVRDTAGFQHDVTLKAEKLIDVGIVMVTSHHLVLYAANRAIVVPISDVTKIEGRPKS
jgi:hypothetical protein